MNNINFTKTVTIDGRSTNAIVSIVYGTDIKGKNYQEIVMRNTGNENIYSIKNDFEDFKISINEAVAIIEKEGFKEATLA